MRLATPPSRKSPLSMYWASVDPEWGVIVVAPNSREAKRMAWFTGLVQEAGEYFDLRVRKIAVGSVPLGAEPKVYDGSGDPPRWVSLFFHRPEAGCDCYDCRRVCPRCHGGIYGPRCDLCEDSGTVEPDIREAYLHEQDLY